MMSVNCRQDTDGNLSDALCQMNAWKIEDWNLPGMCEKKLEVFLFVFRKLIQQITNYQLVTFPLTFTSIHTSYKLTMFKKSNADVLHTKGSIFINPVTQHRPQCAMPYVLGSAKPAFGHFCGAHVAHLDIGWDQRKYINIHYRWVH